MDQTTSHHSLDTLLSTLETRMAALRKKMAKPSSDADKVVAQAKLHELEARHADLAREAAEMKAKGPSFWQSVHADFLVIADSLTHAVDEALRSLDAHAIHHPKDGDHQV